MIIKGSYGHSCIRKSTSRCNGSTIKASSIVRGDSMCKSVIILPGYHSTHFYNQSGWTEGHICNAYTIGAAAAASTCSAAGFTT